MRGSSAVVFLIPNLNIQDEQQIEDVECGAELPAFYSLPYALNVNIILYVSVKPFLAYVELKILKFTQLSVNLDQFWKKEVLIYRICYPYNPCRCFFSYCVQKC